MNLTGILNMTQVQMTTIKLKELTLAKKKNYNKKEIEYLKFWEYGC